MGASQFLGRASTRHMNPNGIPSQSPGLRGTSHPGSAFHNLTNRNTVAALPFPRAEASGHNAVCVVSVSERATQGSSDRPEQPWAEGCNPVGIVPPSPVSKTEMRPSRSWRRKFAIYPDIRRMLHEIIRGGLRVGHAQQTRPMAKAAANGMAYLQ